MKRVSLIIATFIAAIATVQAQNKPKMQGRPSEQSEIRGDNHLAKEQQQKKLKAAPERMRDSTRTTKVVRKTTSKKVVKSKITNKSN